MTTDADVLQRVREFCKEAIEEHRAAGLTGTYATIPAECVLRLLDGASAPHGAVLLDTSPVVG